MPSSTQNNYFPPIQTLFDHSEMEIHLKNTFSNMRGCVKSINFIVRLP